METRINFRKFQQALLNTYMFSSEDTGYRFSMHNDGLSIVDTDRSIELLYISYTCSNKVVVAYTSSSLRIRINTTEVQYYATNDGSLRIRINSEMSIQIYPDSRAMELSYNNI